MATLLTASTKEKKKQHVLHRFVLVWFETVWCILFKFCDVIGSKRLCSLGYLFPFRGVKIRPLLLLLLFLLPPVCHLPCSLIHPGGAVCRLLLSLTPSPVQSLHLSLSSAPPVLLCFHNSPGQPVAMDAARCGF